MEPNNLQPSDSSLQPTNNLPAPASNSASPVRQTTSSQPVHHSNDSNQVGSAPQPPTNQASDASTTTPQIADDSDLIEKEWVIKAKQIVEQTKNDPYLRNQEINKIKADYIKKRYNKDVRTTNE